MDALIKRRALTKRRFTIPETTAHDVAGGLCAQLNLRSALWQAANAGYTADQLRTEVERCISVRPVRRKP